MVLIAICGELGAGKTLSLVYLALRNYQKGRKIYSNFDMVIPHERVRTPEDVLNMKDGFLAADENYA